VYLGFEDGAPLEEVLRLIKIRTRTAGLPNGIPIYVDPAGLTEAGVTLTAPVKAIPPDAPLELSLRRILTPLGLGYSIEEGLLSITFEEAVDRPVEDPFLRFRDLLAD
jgi:hypothetical protein